MSCLDCGFRQGHAHGCPARPRPADRNHTIDVPEDIRERAAAINRRRLIADMDAMMREGDERREAEAARDRMLAFTGG